MEFIIFLIVDGGVCVFVVERIIIVIKNVVTAIDGVKTAMIILYLI